MRQVTHYCGKLLRAENHSTCRARIVANNTRRVRVNGAHTRQALFAYRILKLSGNQP